MIKNKMLKISKPDGNYIILSYDNFQDIFNTTVTHEVEKMYYENYFEIGDKFTIELIEMTEDEYETNFETMHEGKW